ncbi:hypothetical protein FACS189431_4310 [Alphaproteobacteria bacterium]|nr:hypothetical protein FACS189431_4310 [Alphaproteobacteria bacterium]
MKSFASKHRWLIYILIGVVFGIIDYYIQLLTRTFDSRLAYAVVAFGVWLIPAVPIAIYEMKVSKSILRTMLTTVATWVVAVFVYYTYIMFRLMFIGQDSMAHLHISNSNDPYYWENIKSTFEGDVLGRIEWFWAAIVGGAVVGFLAAVIYKVIAKRYLKKSKSVPDIVK